MHMQRMQGEASFSAYLSHDNKTKLNDLYQAGSAKLRFPQNEEKHLEAVMINSAGGSTGGDHLKWSALLGDGAKATITTQANEKIYRAQHDQCVNIEISLNLQQNAQLLWLPQETLFFDNAALKRRINVDIADNCCFLMAEAFVFGRKIMGENVKQGILHDHWYIKKNKTLIHAEAFNMCGNLAEKIKQPICFNQHTAFATLLYIANDCEQFAEPAQKIIAHLGGVSVWNGKLLARLIDTSAYCLRKRLIPLIQLLTKGRGVPKIWAI